MSGSRDLNAGQLQSASPSRSTLCACSCSSFSKRLRRLESFADISPFDAVTGVAESTSTVDPGKSCAGDSARLLRTQPQRNNRPRHQFLAVPNGRVSYFAFCHRRLYSLYIRSKVKLLNRLGCPCGRNWLSSLCLCVEEQFYLVWPLVVWIKCRWKELRDVSGSNRARLRVRRTQPPLYPS
jgi:hypothetical protein